MVDNLILPACVDVISWGLLATYDLAGTGAGNRECDLYFEL
ncbi:hypothetical protein THF1C08_70224 [Vibrio jasicida]|uniref:Uncharacterized protein n=1 Tax=Vibrio jasicida TaxID=766224 RepID=A0AAU9QVT2_9VIBR|nr:hypothetical protein THF1C08_70224 [Vibrio jasicida]CAH1602814.1 hypothetical protein THF1A12_60227 [Vibrio jasicida]